MCAVTADAHVVVVEDDPDIANLVASQLRASGISVAVAESGEEGIAVASATSPDALVIDTALQDLDGFEVCRQVRRTTGVPVLFLTEHDGQLGPALAGELAADDTLTKPFSPRHLVARVRAMLRRSANATPATEQAGEISIGDGICVDLAERTVTAHGAPVPLGTREYDLLAYLAQRQGQAVSRQQLLDAVWGVDWFGEETTVDVHVARLREHIGEDLPLALVWGKGYRLG
jgi:DNA-binding response OmpR family regulator